MTRQELIKDIKQSVGDGRGFITLSDIAKYIGVKSHHSVDKYVNGLDRINGKYYFIPDVADSILRTGDVK
jgi:hypothetical protein